MDEIKMLKTNASETGISNFPVTVRVQAYIYKNLYIRNGHTDKFKIPTNVAANSSKYFREDLAA